MISADDKNVAYFNQIAESWHRVSALPPAAVTAIMQALRIAPGQRVLDVGCGTGLLFPPLLARLGSRTAPDPGYVVGLDPARRMLAIAARTHRDEPRLRLVCASLSQYDGRDGPFDAILCCRVLSHLSASTQAVRQLLRWLSPSGRLVVFEMWEEDALTAIKTKEAQLPPPPTGRDCCRAATGHNWGLWVYDSSCSDL